MLICINLQLAKSVDLLGSSELDYAKFLMQELRS